METSMTHAATPPSLNSKRDRRPRALAVEVACFWGVKKRDVERKPKIALQALLGRLKESQPIRLFEAIEQGAPTSTVLLLAGAFGHTAASGLKMIGVSESTFRRNEEANEPLPEVAGHRIVAILCILMAGFDLEGWAGEWIRDPLPQLGGKTPAELMRNPEGQRAVEELLGRMRGGLPA
jgi:putative toxin-antitoxin system antitoxin component (TIGR02293 family)